MERLITSVLGLGRSEASQLTGVYRRARLASAPSRAAQAGLVLLKPFRAGRRCWDFVRQHSEGLRSTHGVGRLRQVGALLLADLRHSIGPDALVAYHALSAGYPRRWAGYLNPWQVHVVLGALADRCDPRLATLLRDKGTFASWAESQNFPTPTVIARFDGGRRIDGAGDLPPGDLFAKPTNLYCGRGAMRLRWTGRSWTDQDGRSLTPGALTARLTAASHSHPYLVQPCLAPHPALAVFTTVAVPTVRAVTYVDADGRGRLLRAAVRLPLPGMIVDNVTAGGMLAAVDERTGCLTGAVRWRQDGVIEAAEAHAGHGARIAGTPLPDWPAIVALAEAAQEAAASLPFVGWDIALTDAGPVLLEANLRWAVDLLIVGHRTPITETPFLPTLLQAWYRRRTAAGDVRYADA